MDDREAEYRCAIAMREWWVAWQIRQGRKATLTPEQLAMVYGIRGDIDKVFRVA